jgi:hypothetical protein
MHACIHGGARVHAALHRAIEDPQEDPMSGNTCRQWRRTSLRSGDQGDTHHQVAVATAMDSSIFKTRENIFNISETDLMLGTHVS